MLSRKRTQPKIAFDRFVKIHTLVFFLTFMLMTMFNHSFAQDSKVNFTFNDILLKVYKNNPSLQAAKAKLDETRELFPQARAGWLPSAQAETSLFSTNIESSNFSAGTGATTKDLTLNFEQPIFRGGRTFAETKRAGILINAGEALLRDAEQDIFLKAITLYMNLLRDTEILHLRKRYTDILYQERNAAQERYELGEATITDTHLADVRYNRAKSDYINAFATQENSEAKFLEVAGFRPDRLIRPALKQDFPRTLDGLLSQAENQNPEILIAQYEHEAAEHNIEATFRELYPQISAFASYNKQYDPQPGIVEKSETETIGIRATLALYQGGETRSRIRESKYTAKRRQYRIDEIRQKIKQQITSNWNSYKASRKETAHRKDEIKSASLAVEGVREEAMMGQRTILDIFDADEELLNSKIALAKARRNETVTHFTLLSDLGALTINYNDQ